MTSVEGGAGKRGLAVWRKVPEREALDCWRKVPESEAWSSGERCRKARLGLWREVPESETWTVEGGIMYHGHRRSSRNVRKEKAGAWRAG